MKENRLRVGARHGVWIFTMGHENASKRAKKQRMPEQILEASAREAAKDRALLLSQIELQMPVGKEARGVVLGLASLFRDLERMDVRAASRLRWDRHYRPVNRSVMPLREV